MQNCGDNSADPAHNSSSSPVGRQPPSDITTKSSSGGGGGGGVGTSGQSALEINDDEDELLEMLENAGVDADSGERKAEHQQQQDEEEEEEEFSLR